MAIQVGRLVVWGRMICPILPKGFVLKRKPKCVAKAVRKGVEHAVFLKPNQIVPIIREWSDHQGCRNTKVDFTKAISF